MRSAISPPSGVTLLFASSVRTERMNDRVIKLVKCRLRRRGHDVQIADPKQIELPLFAASWSSYNYPLVDAPNELIDLIQLVTSAERFVFTTCEYNCCIPPALSSILDYLPCSAFAYKPAGIISYSISHTGGQMARSQLQLFLARLGCLVMPHSIVINSVKRRISQDGEPIGSYEQSMTLVNDVDLVISQVEYVSNAMQAYRAKTVGYPPKIHP